MLYTIARKIHLVTSVSFGKKALRQAICCWALPERPQCGESCASCRPITVTDFDGDLNALASRRTSLRSPILTGAFTTHRRCLVEERTDGVSHTTWPAYIRAFRNKRLARGTDGQERLCRPKQSVFTACSFSND